MDMDAAFAEPPMAQPEEDRDAESAQALSADEKDERIAELEASSLSRKTTRPLLRTRWLPLSVPPKRSSMRGEQ